MSTAKLTDPLPYDCAIPWGVMVAIAVAQGFNPELFEEALEAAGWTLDTALDTRTDKVLELWKPPGLTDADGNVPVMLPQHKEGGKWDNIPSMLSFITHLKPSF